MFATFSRDAAYTDHRYWYARWDGTKWRKRQIARAGPSIDPDGEVQYTAGIVFDQMHPEVVYLSRKEGPYFQVARWETTDGGEQWLKRTVTTTSKDHVRPVVPWGHPGNGKLPLLYMYGRYDSYRTYKTDIALVEVDA